MDVVFQLFWYPSNSCRIAGCNGWYCCTVLPFFSICCHFRGGIALLEVLFYDCPQVHFRSSSRFIFSLFIHTEPISYLSIRILLFVCFVLHFTVLLATIQVKFNFDWHNQRMSQNQYVKKEW